MKTNAVIENILSRRSTRAFETKPIDHEDLETIVTCGQWAPSAMNRQEWAFIVIESAEKVAHLAKVMEGVLGRGAYNMYAPAAAILVAHKKEAMFGREDDGCAMENMFLAAESLGIGSCWINQLQGICDEPSIRAELDALGVPADFEIHGICALGYTAKATPARDRESQVIWA